MPPLVGGNAPVIMVNLGIHIIRGNFPPVLLSCDKKFMHPMFNIQCQFEQAMRACVDTLHTSSYAPYPVKCLLIGVSGGMDSMVMAHLMYHWTKIQDISIWAVVVDHRLRCNSTCEAQRTKNHLIHMGIPTKIATNHLPPPVTGIQAYARNIRYRLLHKMGKSVGANAVCVAHHYQDCLETVAIRLQQGSTAYGLSAMNMVHPTPDGVVCRPLLKIHKSDINAYADSHKIAYVHDPSNDNRDFTRVRIRQRMAQDMRFYRYLQTVYDESVVFRKHMDTVIRDFLHAHATPIYGTVRIDGDTLVSRDITHAVYIIRHVLMWVSGNYMPPRTQKLYNIIHMVQKNHPATLHGCYIRMLQKNLWIWREPYEIQTQNRFICIEGTVALYGDCAAHMDDTTGDAFVHIPKLVQKTLPVRVYENKILPFDTKKTQKYDKNALLFMPPLFIL